MFAFCSHKPSFFFKKKRICFFAHFEVDWVQQEDIIYLLHISISKEMKL